MRIGFSTATLLLFSPGYWSTAIADTDMPNYELQMSFTGARLKGVTLGNDASLDRLDDDEITITITPTYAGCPAMHTMQTDIETVLQDAGYKQVKVKQSLSPAWSTDWMTQNGREKLRAYGIAPPLKTSCNQSSGGIECPQCNSSDVKRISEFGSTACKALYQCRDCLEPFDYFKCI